MSSTDLSQFYELGYQIVPGLIDRATVDAARGFLERELAALDPIFEKYGFRHDDRSAAAVIADVLSHTRASLDDPDWHLLSGHFPLRTRLSRELWPVFAAPRFQAILRELLASPNIFMHMPPMARYVLPNNRSAAVPAHQDISYNSHLADFVVAWVPLVPIDDQCGGMAVYERSHRAPLALDAGAAEGWFPDLATDSFVKHVCAPMKPGDAILFGPTLIHGSVPNISDRTRFSLDMRFFPESGYSSRHVLDLQTWAVLEPTSSKK
jgi:ectoine hydroxylase-related dioxygenase (phytanoyl-CoA dioxygenase family)